MGSEMCIRDSFWGQKPSEELYDMSRDPDSVHNLVAEPAHRATLERMRAALREHTLQVKDNGLLPEGSPLEGYDASRALGAWDVAKTYELACLASDRDPANLPKFIAALSDPSEPIRLGRPAEALRVLERLILRKDDEGTVMIAGNVLDRMGEAARPSLPAMKQAFATETSTKLESGKYAPTHILKHTIDVLEGRVDALVYPDSARLAK